MKIRLREILNSRFDKKEFLVMLQETPSLLQDLVDIACGTHHPTAWRAAWMLEHYANGNSAELQQFLPQLLAAVAGKEDGHQRCMLKLFMQLELDEDQESMLFNHCFNLYENLRAIPSLRITALDYILSVVETYPELKGEVLHLFDERYGQGLSPGIKTMWKRKGAKLLRS